MIIEKESEIKVLRTFCENPFDYFSIAELSERAGISRNWSYKIIKKFDCFDILRKLGKKCKLDFSDNFCKRLKLLFDADYLGSLSPEFKKTVFDLANKIIFEMKPQSVVLVGSIAQLKMRKGSDVDFLVIGQNKEKLPNLENANITLISEKDFEGKYLKGDDFVISALAFGRVIHDTGAFLKFIESPLPIFSQELIQEKIKYCERLEERVYLLLKMDENRARNELLYLALQAGRIKLLKNGIIPKTKYDIASQVEPLDNGMAKLIRKLLTAKNIRLQRMIDYAKECMSAIR